MTKWLNENSKTALEVNRRSMYNLVIRLRFRMVGQKLSTPDIYLGWKTMAPYLHLIFGFLKCQSFRWFLWYCSEAWLSLT